MASVYFPLDHTPAEWREMAAECSRRSQESWERSDTDGYLSQWAGDLTARLYRVCADVAERGGLWDFRLLADADGVPIDGAREYRTRYGWAWRVPRPSGERVWFNPSNARDDARRAAADLRKGYRFVTVERPAVVMMISSGGLMGCAPAVFPRRSADREMASSLAQDEA